MGERVSRGRDGAADSGRTCSLCEYPVSQPSAHMEAQRPRIPLFPACTALASALDQLGFVDVAFRRMIPEPPSVDLLISCLPTPEKRTAFQCLNAVPCQVTVVRIYRTSL